MHKTRSVFLTLSIFTLSSLLALAAEAGSGEQSKAPSKAEINSLPPVGKGQNLVKPYQKEVSGPERVSPVNRGNQSKSHAPTPLSREIVPPSYRYGSPGYMPDGRGGRGYDFGYPGYRDQGGGGYPHHRQTGTQR